MNGWERNGKRACKAVILFVSYFFLCQIIGIEPSVWLWILVCSCILIDSILDDMWPTAGSAITSHNRSTAVSDRTTGEDQ